MLVLALAAAQAQTPPPPVPVQEAEPVEPVQSAPTTPALPATPALPDPPEAPALPTMPVPPAPPAPLAGTAHTKDLFDMDDVVRVSDPVADNAFLMARSVDVEAPVQGDIFSMGESITIDQPVNGDVYAMGATVVVTENGSIGGDLKGFAGEVDLRGPVAGDVSVQAGELTLAAPIAGSLAFNAERVTVKPGAAIAGDLSYSAVDRNDALEAIVAGEVDFEIQEIEVDIDIEEEEEESSFVADAAWWAGMRSWGYFTKLLVGCVLFFLGGRWLANAGRTVGDRPGYALGVGFVAACMIPILSTLALVTVVPFPLGLLGFTMLGILLYVGQLFTAQALGDFVLHRIRPEAVGNPYISLAVGLLPLMALFAIPWLGSLAWLAATAIGIGGLFVVFRDLR